MTDSLMDQLARALDQAGRALDAVTDDHLDHATPCSDWTVRQLADHVASDPSRMAQMGRGEKVDFDADPGIAVGEWSPEFRAGADELLAQMRGLPADKQGSAGFWIAEFAVHSWDLARGTGADVALDDEVAETGLAAMQRGLTDDRRGNAFGAEVQVGPDAGAYERLAAFSGRDPQA